MEALCMAKKKRTQKMPLDQVRGLLESGLVGKYVSRASGYNNSQLSLMCRLWGIKRKMGRPRKSAQVVRPVESVGVNP
jgi:hypothetical protein